MNRERLVSICIASYRHEAFLPASIESALGQTYPNVEVIVVDDGSPDASYEIALSYAARYPDRVKVFTHPGRENRGISATVNLALRHASGAFWSGLPSDDMFAPEKTELQVAHLERTAGLAFSHGRAALVDRAGARLAGAWGSPTPVGDDEFLRVIESCAVVPPTVFVSMDAMRALGDHREGLVFSDWEFWIRLFARYSGEFLDRELVRYRVHDYNTSWGAPQDVSARNAYEVFVAVADRAAEIGGRLEEPRARALTALQAAFYAYCLGRPDDADDHLAAAFELDASAAVDRGFLERWLYRRHASTVRASSGLPPEGGGRPAFVDWFVDAAARPGGVAPARLGELRAAARWAVASGHFESGESWRAATDVVRTWRLSPAYLARPRAWRILAGGVGKAFLPASVVAALGSGRRKRP